MPKFIIELQGNSNCEIQYKVTFSGENDGGSCKENYTPVQFMSKAEYNKQCAQEVVELTRLLVDNLRLQKTPIPQKLTASSAT